MNNARSRTSIRTLVERTTVEDFLFYCAFAIFSCAEILKDTAFTSLFKGLSPLCTAILYCSVALLVLRLIILRASHFQWIVVFAICALAGILYRLYGLQYPLWIFLFVVTGKGVDLKTLAKITLIITGVLTFITVFSCYAGLIENYTMIETDTRSLRNAMGFTHPNRLGQRFAEVCIAYWFLYVREHRGKVIALCLVSLLYVNFVSNSRTSCFVFAVLILTAILLPVSSRNPRISVCVCGITVAFIVGYSFFLMAFYDASNSFMADLNQLMSGRLKLMNICYKYAGPSLLGNDYSGGPVLGHTVATQSEIHFWVDNAYAHLLLLYGVIATVLFLFLIFLVYRNCYRLRTFPLALLGLTVLLAVGFVENCTLDIQYNYFILLISDVLYAGGLSLNTRRKYMLKDGLCLGPRTCMYGNCSGGGESSRN